MYRIHTKLVILSVIFHFLYGCAATQSSSKEASIITKNEIYETEKLLKNDAVNLVVTTTPNSTFLEIPWRKKIYDWSHPNPEVAFENWLQKKAKRPARLSKWFSDKQVMALKNYAVKFNEWLRKTGEAPAVYDALAIEKSKNRIVQYYKNLGYFDVQVRADSLQPKPKRITLQYNITPNQRYLIDSITTAIAAPDLDSLYQKMAKESFLKPGDPFVFRRFDEERDRIVNQFRNYGVYNFQGNNIKYIAAIDSSGQDIKIPVKLSIDNIQRRINDTLFEFPYRIHTVKKIDVFIEDSNAEKNRNPFTDSLVYENLTLHSKGKLKYKPNAIADGISIQANALFSETDRTLTYRYFSNLKNFKYPSINYEPIAGDSTALAAQIYLTPKERFSLGFDLDLSHSNIQDFGIGLGGGLGIRNVFRGTELLELNVKSNIGASRDLANANDRFFNLFEFGGDVKLSVPRIVLPFGIGKLIPTKMYPNTQMILGTSLQENIGLDKQFFSTTYQFDWQPNEQKKLNFKLMDLEFVNNTNIVNYFNVYKNSFDRLNSVAQNHTINPNWVDGNENLTIPAGSLSFIDAVLRDQTEIKPENPDYKIVNNIKERLDRLTANNLILGSSFSYNLNNQQSIFDENFFQVRWKFEWVGNLLQLAHRINGGSNIPFEINGVLPSQYVKTELDYIKHWSVGRKRVVAVRFFGGIAIPYGNATNLPFSRSFFSGGSNDNRAWRAYKLGPGSSSNINEFNEANFKLAMNVEYRFPLLGSLQGALFVDGGNIWNLWDDVEDPAMRFDGLQDLSEIAIGSGIGFRYDFDFFVFRLDTGFKTYNPALPQADRWWTEYRLKKAVFNIGINYPF